MSWYSSYVRGGNKLFGTNLYNQFKSYAWPYIRDYGQRVLGYTQYKNTQASLSAQMDYEQYLKSANERAYADWQRNVPNRSIKYPEFSYLGQIRKADTSIAAAGFSYDNAYSNYIGGLANRSLGLYSVPGRLYRNL